MILKMLNDQGQLRAGTICTVAHLFEVLEPAEADELREALASSYRTSDIARVLVKMGHKVKANTLSRHRRGECCCQQEPA